MKLFTLRSANNVLTVVNIGLAVYILCFPFLASIRWWFEYEAPVRIATPATVTIPSGNPVKMANTLYIPSIGLTEQIYQGQSVATLEKGAWHRPATNQPGTGGNSVIVAHRFSYSGSGVFYHLDKVAVGDEIGVHWEGEMYTYVVKRMSTVPATAIEVEQPSDEEVLTLYTCTPLWNPKDRLVITAQLKEAL